MGELSINNVISVSVAQAGVGIGKYNTSNLAIFTAEEFDAGLFGSDGYKIYLEPVEVSLDFGSDSKTFAMANAIFSQQPNILAGRGYLVIIPMTKEVQTITPDATPASGTFKINFDGGITGFINWDDTPAVVQTALRLVAGLEDAIVTGSIATSLTITMHGVEEDAPLMTITDNTVQDSGSTPIVFTIAESVEGETIGEAITRTNSLVQYFGVIHTAIESQVDMLAVAAIIQPLNKIYATISNIAADIDVDGKLDKLRSGTFTQSRGLFYGGTEDEALVFMASYMGRGLSTIFNGSNTTQTMHLKTLIGVQPDATLTQTLLNKAIAAGVDTYANIEGVAKVFTSGLNSFFDDVYNLLWFVGAIKVTGFNVLATVSTKVPQTEEGLSLLKGAYRKIAEQGITNTFLAPGDWNSPTTFGIQQDLYDNIRQRGYYIYSAPVSQQAVTDREDRIAPLVQIAIKYAGANHSASVIININR